MYDEIISLLILSHCRGLGKSGIHKLIAHYGSAEQVVKEGWKPTQHMLFDKWQGMNWESDYETCLKEKISIIPYTSASYPQNLLKISDYPLLLYVKGNLKPEDEQGIALIGTRNATLYGKQNAEKIAQECAKSGISVISGLARGIDTAAHIGALKGFGRTLGIMGSGLSRVYPQENRGLVEKISETGAVMSEYPMDTPPSKYLFPQRNRIVSAIAQGVCLIESPLKGGGMLTMQIARKYNKKLFSLPGRVDYPTFEGNHWLIKNNYAKLIEHSNDILQQIGVTTIKPTEIKKSNLLSKEEELFLKKLPFEEKSIEELVLLTQLPVMQLNILLTRLVLKKVVKEFPGKIYKKVSQELE